MISFAILQKKLLASYSNDWWQAQISHPIGQINVVGTGDALVGVGFGRQVKSIESFLKSLDIKCQKRELSFEHLMNFRKIRTIGTSFQEAVWQALLKIPHGEVRTYSDIAVQINNPKAIRAVGTAVGSNPVSILIPCHRVLPKAGGIGQYHWGSNVKTALLEIEGALIIKSL